MILGAFFKLRAICLSPTPKRFEPMTPPSGYSISQGSNLRPCVQLKVLTSDGDDADENDQADLGEEELEEGLQPGSGLLLLSLDQLIGSLSLQFLSVATHLGTFLQKNKIFKFVTKVKHQEKNGLNLAWM